MILKLKIDGEEFTTRLPLREAAKMKAKYELKSMQDLDLSDPDQLIDVLTLAVETKHSEWTPGECRAYAENLDFFGLEAPDETADPTPAATANAAAVAESSGSPETTLAQPGVPS